MIIDTLIKWAIPTILAMFLGYITKELRDNKLSNKAMKESMVLMLRSQIVGKVEDYTTKGFLPDYARTCLDDLFKQYTALGGNHGVNILVTECFKLPPVNRKKVNYEK